MCSSRWAMPVSPYPSWREPTSTVMLTVTVGLVASGNSSTRAPVARRYSVTPSTVATFLGASAAWAVETKKKTRNKGIHLRMAVSSVWVPGDARVLPENQLSQTRRLRPHPINGSQRGHDELFSVPADHM